MTSIQDNNVFSKYLAGTAYLDVTEQNNYEEIMKDNKIDKDEILSMTLMYNGTEITVSDLLAIKSSEGQEVNLNFMLGDKTESSNIDIAEVSSSTTTSATSGVTQSDIYNQLIEDMIWDELEEQLKETASQGNTEFSYDSIND
jgi:hypothetical protein